MLSLYKTHSFILFPSEEPLFFMKQMYAQLTEFQSHIHTPFPTPPSSKYYSETVLKSKIGHYSCAQHYASIIHKYPITPHRSNTVKRTLLKTSFTISLDHSSSLFS